MRGNWMVSVWVLVWVGVVLVCASVQLRGVCASPIVFDLAATRVTFNDDPSWVMEAKPKVGGGLELKYTIEYLAERVDPIAQSGPLGEVIRYNASSLVWNRSQRSDFIPPVTDKPVSAVAYTTSLPNGAYFEVVLHVIPDPRDVYIDYRNFTFGFDGSSVKYSLQVNNWSIINATSRYIVVGMNVDSSVSLLSDVVEIEEPNEDLIELRIRIEAYLLRMRFLNYGILDSLVSRFVIVDFGVDGLFESNFQRLPVTCSFRAVQNITYDPDFSILFSSLDNGVEGPGVDNSEGGVQTGMVVGIVVALCAVVLIVAIVVLVTPIRRKIFPFLRRGRNHATLAIDNEDNETDPDVKEVMAMDMRAGSGSSAEWTSSQAPHASPLFNLSPKDGRK